MTIKVYICTLKKKTQHLGFNDCIAFNKPFTKDAHMAKTKACISLSSCVIECLQLEEYYMNEWTSLWSS